MLSTRKPRCADCGHQPAAHLNRTGELGIRRGRCVRNSCGCPEYVEEKPRGIDPAQPARVGGTEA